MNLAFWGTVMNAVGSLVIVFTPLVTAYGGPVHPSRILQWRSGWSLLVVGSTLQAIAAYSRG